jgi:hypothetical protein
MANFTTMPDAELQKVVDLHRKGVINVEIARTLGLTKSTITYRLKQAAKRGLLGPNEQPVLPGYKITGISTLTDANGDVKAQWVKTKEGESDPLEVAELLKDAFQDYETKREPTPVPDLVARELLTLLPVNDLHLGMFAWGRETEQNWDLKIAERVLGAAYEDVIARSPASGTGVVLVGGDLFHSDNNRNRTEKNGNPLDVDGRYPKVMEAAGKLVVKACDAMLARHGKLVIRVLPGNHDTHSAVAVTYFLLAWYREDPRVFVDTDPSLFWWYRFGRVMFGSTHGHEAKITQMPSIMAHRRAEDWGKTKFRYVHGFHLHHTAKYATEGQGVISEIHQAPIPQDAWHFGSGFLSGRSVQAITYHEDYGEVGRVRGAVLDGK